MHEFHARIFKNLDAGLHGIIEISDMVTRQTGNRGSVIGIQILKAIMLHLIEYSHEVIVAAAEAARTFQLALVSQQNLRTCPAGRNPAALDPSTSTSLSYDLFRISIMSSLFQFFYRLMS